MKQPTFRALRRLCRAALPSWLCSLLMLTAGSFAGLAATIQTDLSDYPPGSTALISGTGWQAGETVTLEVDHVATEGTFGEGHEAWYVVADELGNVTSEWYVNPDDSAGATFRLTADGGTSLRHAEWLFTDNVSNVNIVTPTGFSTIVTPTPAGGIVNVPFAATFVTDDQGSGGLTTAVQISVYLKNGPTSILVYQASYSGLTQGLAIFGDALNPNVAAVNMPANGGVSDDNYKLRVEVTPLNGSTTGGSFEAANNWVTVPGTPPGCVSPVITCPSTITVDSAPGLCSANVTFAATATGTTPTITYTVGGSPVLSGASFPVGTTTVTATANNACGSDTCTFDVTVIDNENPTVSCPANIVVDNDAGQCSAVVNFTLPSGADNCGVDTVVAVPASGSTFAVGTTPVTITVTDIHGNQNTCTFDVTVNDTEKPTVTCPANVVVDNDAGQCLAVVNFTLPSGADNCGVDTVVAVPASGSTFAVGTTPVTITVTDIHGNQNTCSFDVTVNDTEKPTVTCPANIVVDNDAGQCLAVVNFTLPSGADNCGVDTVVAVPASGSTFAVGTTPVTITVTDIHGNQNTCSFDVTVNDTEKPTVTCPANIVVNNEAGKCSAVVNFTLPSGADNCGVATVVAVPASGSTFAVGTTPVTITVTDIHGNQNTCSFNVTVNDTEAPTITCPANIQVTATSGCSKILDPGTPQASDNCSYTVVGTRSDALPLTDAYPVGCTKITWTAKDGANNTAVCTQTVLVEANVAIAYTGDTLVFTAGPTTTSASVTLKAQLTPSTCFASLNVLFEVWSSSATPSLLKSVQVPADATGLAMTTVVLNAQNTYCVKVKLVYLNSCGVTPLIGTPNAEACVAVDFGSTDRRVTGGGWILNNYSDNKKGTFGFTANYVATKTKVTPTGNSVFMLHNVAGFNWKVKDSTWNGASMSFYHNPAVPGTVVDSGRVTIQGVVQQINPVTGQVVGGFGNATIVLDVFDGDLYTPALKDAYSIKVYNGNDLWFGSNTSFLPLGNNGPGGGNIKVFSK